MDFEELRLRNGIRVVLLKKPGVVSHAALTVLAGSRFESKEEEGLAHFIEHGFFKGTQKRKAFHVLSRLDSVGGELNAYTTKEDISIHTSFMNEHMDRALEIMADIVFRSSFPPKEMEKEKDIIVDEIQSYKDNPVESIFDEFEELIFGKHPLAHPILGSEETVRSFTVKSVAEYIKNNFTADRISLVVVGDFKEKTVKRLIDKYFSEINLIEKSPVLTNTDFIYRPFSETAPRSQYQTHTILGIPAYDYKDEKRLVLTLLNNWLGGPALNSRLSLLVREKYGYTYNIESSYTPFIDTGLFSIYFGTDMKHTAKTLKIILKELKRIASLKMGVNQLNMAKAQLKGNLALAHESNLSTAIGLGRSILSDEKLETIEELYKKIDAISSSDLLEVANELFVGQEISVLTYTPDEK